MAAPATVPIKARPSPLKGRVLIFSDDLAEVRAVKQAVEAAGVDCVGVCGNPAEAAGVARETRPDLALVAVYFHGEPVGVELSRQIQDELGSPVIFLGAAEDPLLLLQIAMTQPAGFVADPQDSQYLQAVLGRALRGPGPGVAGPY